MESRTIEVGKYKYKSFNGSLWTLIFYHNATFNATFDDENEVLSSNKEDKYSIIGEIRSSHRIDGKYEFLFEYPQYSGKYNQWKQRNAPHKEIDYAGKTQALGYEPINIDWSGSYWGGLQRLKIAEYYPTYIKGSFSSDLWFYSIGKFSEVSESWAKPIIPGPNGQSDKEVYLWMRVRGFDAMRITCKQNYRRQQSYIQSIMLIIVIKR